MQSLFFSTWAALTKGLRQASVFCPLLLNIYFNDLFYLSECKEKCNFADDANFFAFDN